MNLYRHSKSSITWTIFNYLDLITAYQPVRTDMVHHSARWIFTPSKKFRSHTHQSRLSPIALILWYVFLSKTLKLNHIFLLLKGKGHNCISFIYIKVISNFSKWNHLKRNGYFFLHLFLLSIDGWMNECMYFHLKRNSCFHQPKWEVRSHAKLLSINGKSIRETFYTNTTIGLCIYFNRCRLQLYEWRNTKYCVFIDKFLYISISLGNFQEYCVYVCESLRNDH